MIVLSLAALSAVAILMVRYLARSSRPPVTRWRWVGDSAYVAYALATSVYSGSVLAESQTAADTVVFAAGSLTGLALLVLLLIARVRGWRERRTPTRGPAEAAS